MKIKLKTLLVWVIAISAGVVLLYTSQSVQKAEAELKALNTELAQENELQRVLEAEWAFLTAPERLESLAERYLDRRIDEPAVASRAVLEETGGSVYHDASFSMMGEGSAP
jgi:hypothetical protein